MLRFPALSVHEPPVGVAVRLIVAPWQIGTEPVMAEGWGLTVNAAVVKHPVGAV